MEVRQEEAGEDDQYFQDRLQYSLSVNELLRVSHEQKDEKAWNSGTSNIPF